MVSMGACLVGLGKRSVRLTEKVSNSSFSFRGLVGPFAGRHPSCSVPITQMPSSHFSGLPASESSR